MDVSQSPWKIMKYMFNRKVMSALKVSNLLCQGQAFPSDSYQCCIPYAWHACWAQAS